MTELAGLYLNRPVLLIYSSLARPLRVIKAAWVERTASECEYPAENAWLSLASYRTVLLSTAPNHSFPVQLKTKSHGVTSTLHVFEPSEHRLQHPRLRSTTNFVYSLSHFFHTRSHSLSPGCRAQLSMNCTQPLKPLNNTKFRTATTSLHCPFHPGG